MQIFLKILKSLYAAWMGLAFILSWINTRLILVVIFYLVITPIAIILRALGKDLLASKTNKAEQSYWIARTEHERQSLNYEKQF